MTAVSGRLSMFPPHLQEIPVAKAKSYKFRSNSELARALGCHLTAAIRLRAGRRRPSLDMAVNVVNTFELTGAKAYEGIAAMQEGGEAQAAFFDQYVGGWTPPVAASKK